MDEDSKIFVLFIFIFSPFFAFTFSYRKNVYLLIINNIAVIKICIVKFGEEKKKA